jgi:hydroxypyruvate reductase
MLGAAIAAALPERCLPPWLPPPPRGRLIVIGAGKAAASMAAAVEANWPGPLSGLVVTRYGHRVPTQRIEVVEAAHPVPDAAGLAAARRIRALVQGLNEDDLVLALISGGGSALLVEPAEGVSLEEKRALTSRLLACGASIHEINCVRKHLSAIKGGRLAAAAWPAQVVTLAISDVAGDDPEVIASGPTVADPSTCADALAVLARYRIELPAALRSRLAAGELETPKPGDTRLARASFHLVASPLQALAAAADVARAAGVVPLILGDQVEGEAREVARAFAGIARSCASRALPLPAPCVLLSGGETTVTLGASPGRGGRNSEFLLASALAIDGCPGIYALAADTDGIDGSEDNAGAVVTPDTLARACSLGIDPRRRLDEHDAWGVFDALGDLVRTGPTMTNVNDFRAILVV